MTKNSSTQMNVKFAPLRLQNDATRASHLEFHEGMNKIDLSECEVIWSITKILTK